MESRSRLTPEREAEIFEAVVGLLKEHGYEGLVMQHVAVASKASTATLYRHWSGKPQLVVAALQHRRQPPLADIDTGRLRGDLIEGARRMAGMSDEDGSLMAALTHAAKTDPELSDAMNEALAQPMAEAANTILDNAVARGEISPTAPGREFLTELLSAATITRRLVTGVTPTESYLMRYVDAVLIPALGAR